MSADLYSISLFTNKTIYTTGETITGNVYTYNGGSTSASSSYVKYYLSSDSTLSSSDKYLGSDYVSSLSSGSYERDTLSFSTTGLSGYYYLIAKTDAYSQVSESSESNNIKTSRFYVGGSADLYSSSLSTSKTSYTAGETATATVYTRNAGSGTAGYSYVKYYLSSDSTLSSSDKYLGSDYVSSLSSGSYERDTLSFSTTGLSGYYYLIAKTDAYSQVSESSESNNIKTSRFYVGGSADLYSYSLSTSKTSYTAGETATATVYTRNAGSGTAGYSYVKYYLSSDSTLSSSDKYLGSDYVSSLSSGSYEKDTLSFSTTGLSGYYYLIAKTDAYSQVSESSESNNTKAYRFYVNGSADLYSYSLYTSKTSYSAGETATATVYTYNKGTSTAGSSYVKYYLSSDSTLSSSDKYLGSDYVSSLSSGSYERDTLSFSTSGLSGYYYLIAKTDAYSKVSESSESNNTKAYRFYVNGSADLYSYSLYTSKTSYTAGETATATVYTRNAGSGTAGSSYVKYYLSSDSTLSSSDKYLGNDYVSSLSSGSYERDTLSFSTSGLSGYYYLIAKTDAYSKVSESSESNNTKAYRFYVNGSADLYSYSLYTSKTSYSAGETATATVYTYNKGTSTAGSSYVKYYLSSDSTLSSSDKYLGNDYVSSLSSGSYERDTLSFSTSGLSGYYYLIAKTDAYSKVSESSESNNTKAYRFYVNGSADLYSYSLYTSKTSYSAGETATATVYTYNKGTSTAGSSYVKYYLSSDSTLSSSDKYLGNDYVSSLSSGSYERDTLSFSTSGLSGYYYLIAKTDAYSKVSESSESNNTKTYRFYVNGSADLYSYSLYTSKTSYSAGETATATVYTYNKGTSTAGSSYVKYYLSSDSTLSSSDKYLGNDYVSSLSSGSYERDTLSFSTSGLSGYYYLIAKTDAYSKVSESSESNNTKAYRFYVNGSADLYSYSLYTSKTSYSAGETATATVYTYNKGTSTAGSSYVKYYLSSDSTLSSSDKYLGSDYVSSLSSGSYERDTLSFSTSGLSGYYYLIAKTDAYSQVSESSESNNIKTSRFYVGGSADLYSYSLSTSKSSYTAGETATATVYTRNAGSGTAGYSYVKYYLSSDSTLSSSDKYLGSDYVSSLSSGSYERDTLSFSTTGLSGYYYLIAKTDAYSQVSESSESNNIKTSRFYVGGSADLYSYSLSTSKTSYTAGETATATVYTRNAGSGTAGYSYVKYYLSSDSTLSSSDKYLGSDYVSSLSSGSYERDTLSFSTTGLSGYYYLIAKTDAYSQVSESSESNNIKTSRFYVGGSADLYSYSLSTSKTSYTAGETATATVYTRNAGSGTAGYSYVKYYLSSDSTLSSSDKYLGSDYVSSLSFGSYEKDTLSFSTTGLSGYYYLIAKTDAYSQVSESSESNNIKTSRFYVGGSADLYSYSLSTSKTSYTAGETATATVYTRNAGSGTAGYSYVKYYLSSDSTLSSSDKYLGNDYVSSLSSGSYERDTLSFSTTGLSGYYYLIAKTDAYSQVSESSESNNIKTSRFYVGGSADLYSYSLSTSKTSYTAGETATATVYTRNAGSGTAGYSYVKYYLSSDSTLSSSDKYLGSDYVSSLSSGSYERDTLSFSTTGLSGYYYLIAKTDAYSQVSESSESNNIKTSRFYVGGSADLYSYSLSTNKTSYTAGETATATVYTRNAGSGTAGYSYVKYYLSSDSTLSSSDKYLGSDYVSSLSSGSYEKDTLSFSTTGLSGYYYLIAKTDAYGYVRESSESNNTKASRFYVSGADLYSSSLSTSKTSYTAGETATATVYTRNAGSGTAGYSYVKYYLSSDSTLSSSDKYLGSDYVSSLSSGSYERDTLSFSTTGLSGYYYLIAKTDAYGYVRESSESNNTKASRFYVSGADLYSSSLSTSKTSYTAGETATATVYTRNAGSGTAGYSYVKYYLSSDSTLSSSDRYLGSDYVGSLSSGSYEKDTLNFSTSGLSGKNYIIVKTDSYNSVHESNESNNTRAYAFSVATSLSRKSSALLSSTPSLQLSTYNNNLGVIASA